MNPNNFRTGWPSRVVLKREQRLVARGLVQVSTVIWTNDKGKVVEDIIVQTARPIPGVEGPR